jgi:hypothetical protein
MLFLATLFESLPSATLGAVVIDAMIGLIGLAPTCQPRFTPPAITLARIALRSSGDFSGTARATLLRGCSMAAAIVLARLLSGDWSSKNGLAMR